MGDASTGTLQKRTICFSCSQQCGQIAFIEDGRVARVVGDRQHPRTAGFICPKGAHAPQLHASAERLHEPLKRTGPRGSGRWSPISWEKAIDEIGEQILKIAEDHGPEAVAYTFGTVRGSDHSIGKRFMNVLGSPNSVGQDKICLGPLSLGEFLTYGFGPTTGTRPTPGLTESLLLWGARPSQSARPAWRQIERALACGTKLIVIDPARTAEAEAADVWLRPLPGSDAALGLALLHEIIAADRYDSAFVASETIGFAALKQRVAAYSADSVAPVTGVSAVDIRRAAALLSGEGPTIFSGGNGLCQTGVGAVQQGRIIACLVAITGNLNKPGAHILHGPPRDILGNGDWMAQEAISPSQRAKALGAERFGCIGSRYDQLDELLADAWHGKRGVADWLASAHEPTLWEAILTGEPYPVKALIVQAHNPIGGSANTARAREALLSSNLQLLVGHDLFLNATSSLCDYVLPAAHWLEKPYFSLGAGYTAPAGDYVEAAQATIAPEHGHRDDYEFWRDLGPRCGQAAYWPADAKAFYQTLLNPAGLTFDEVADTLGPLFGAAARAPSAPTRPRSTRRYGTKSGMVELESGLLADWDLDPLPNFQLSSVFDHAEAYPLILTTGGRELEGFHQTAQQTPAYRKKNPHPLVTLHPDLAAAQGLKDGEWVTIETPVGRARQMVQIADEYPAQVVRADRWWYPEGGGPDGDEFGVLQTSINMCTSNAPGDLDPVMGAWLLRGLPCRVYA